MSTPRSPHGQPDLLASAQSRRGIYRQGVLVTGGAQGIGRGIAEAFAARGALVAIADPIDAARERRCTAIAAAGGRGPAPMRSIWSSASRSGSLVAAVEADFGRLDVVVHNAAYFPLTAFDAITPAILHAPSR